MEAKDLTAKEIFNRIMGGERIYLPTRDPVIIENLKNHLNVLKSQAKKTFKELGFEFKNSVIKIEDHDKPGFLSDQLGKAYVPGGNNISIMLPWSVVYLVAAKPSQKYNTFIIGNSEQPAAGSKAST